MGKKAQIFLFDLILSVVIFMVSVGILATYFINKIDNTDIHNLNYQIMDGFTKLKINDLNNPEIRTLFINNQIVNVDNTIAQQVSEFYYNGNFLLAKNLTRIYVNDYIGRNFNVNVSLVVPGVSTFELFSKSSKPKLEAQIVSQLNRQIFGFINTTNYYGPYEFEIVMWT